MNGHTRSAELLLQLASDAVGITDLKAFNKRVPQHQQMPLGPSSWELTEALQGTVAKAIGLDFKATPFVLQRIGLKGVVSWVLMVPGGAGVQRRVVKAQPQQPQGQLSPHQAEHQAEQQQQQIGAQRLHSAWDQAARLSAESVFKMACNWLAAAQ